MEKRWILLWFIAGILYASASQSKKARIKLDDYKHPGDIIESVHSTAPEVPQIKIRLADADEEDDDADASITMDLGDDNEDADDDDDEEEEPVLIRPKKLPKSKKEDIHSFL